MKLQDQGTIDKGLDQAKRLIALLDEIRLTRETFDQTNLYARMASEGFFNNSSLEGEDYANQSAIGNVFQALTDVRNFVEGELFADVPIYAVNPEQADTVVNRIGSKRNAFAMVRR